jgi:gamma-glutamyl-gamma-aminobutyrate hydrolase PuuD
VSASRPEPAPPGAARPRIRPATPRIVVTVAAPVAQPEPEVQVRKNELYADALARHGAEPILLDATASETERAAAFAAMHGLLLAGGADVHPARYGQPVAGSTAIETDRDELEAQAWAAADERALAVLGICRGFQVINVMRGGTLLQHVDGHAGPAYGRGPAREHPLRIVPGTRLARILFPSNVRGGVLTVNTYHHQAVRPSDLAPGLVASAWASSGEGNLVEGFEAEGGRFIVGVQCHPERTESTPAAFERLFGFFVDSCRGPAGG